MVGMAAASRFGRLRWARRAVVLALLLACALLTFFPERYRAAVTLTPTDPSSMGLSGTLGQLGAINSVFGNQAAVEVSLKVARSILVRNAVIRRLDLVRRMGFDNSIDADRWLERKMEVRSLRGGIVQLGYIGRDPVFARDLVTAFADATRSRLSEIARTQTAYKRDVLVKLVTDASDRLARAQAAYDSFRLRTRYGQPGTAIAAIGERVPVLEASIKAKDVQLSAARQFATDDNMSVRQLVAERAALVQQLNQAKATSPTQPNSVGRVVQQSTQAQKLERELAIAQGLYDSYKRFLEGTSVEDLTSTASVRVLEPPFVDTARQLNYSFLALGILVLLIGVAV